MDAISAEISAQILAQQNQALLLAQQEQAYANAQQQNGTETKSSLGASV